MKKTSEILNDLQNYKDIIETREQQEEWKSLQRLKATLKDESDAVQRLFKDDMQKIVRLIHRKTKELANLEKRLQQLEKDYNRDLKTLMDETKFTQKIQLITFVTMIALCTLISYAIP